MDVAKRTVIQNPLSDDPNAGIIVAPGDPLPGVLSGVVSNNPNRVDAAANYDDVDAADRARTTRPATRVVDAPDPTATREIHERVAAGRSSWFESDADLRAQAASPSEPPADATRTAAATTTTPDTPDPTPPRKLNVEQLDRRYGGVEGYPKSASKAEKVAFAEAQEA